MDWPAARRLVAEVEPTARRDLLRGAHVLQPGPRRIPVKRQEVQDAPLELHAAHLRLDPRPYLPTLLGLGQHVRADLFPHASEAAR